MRTYIFNQFYGLGDLLFLMPLAERFVDNGFKVIIPVVDKNYPIAKHFPDVTILPKTMLNINYNSLKTVVSGDMTVIPFRFSNIVMNVHGRYVMKSKYDMVGEDFNIWRELKWKRDRLAESSLVSLLRLPEKFIFVNENFNAVNNMTSQLKIKSDLPVVKMQFIKGYTMLDWYGVLQRATEIHTVHTSLHYMIEVMDLSCPIHIYRRPSEKDMSNFKYLFAKKYYYHE